jgi:hypothetical protein
MCAHVTIKRRFDQRCGLERKARAIERKREGFTLIHTPPQGELIFAVRGEAPCDACAMSKKQKKKDNHIFVCVWV